MQKLAFIALLIAVVFGTLARATDFTVVESAEAPAVTEMVEGSLYYNFRIIGFDEWQDGAEKTVLNLHPEFRKGVEAETADGKFENTVLFIARTSVVLNRPASSINLSMLRDLAVVQKLQGDLASVAPLTVPEIITNQKHYLNYRNPASGWCTAPEALCFKSHFNFDIQTYIMIMIVMAVRGSDGNLDSQSQVSLQTADLLATRPEVQELTGVNTAPTGLISMDSFYFSHVMEFAKVVGVVQPHPTDASKSIVTGFTVFAIERKWWDVDIGGIIPRDVFLGKAHNGTSGIMMGLPKVTQQLFGQLANMLEAQPR